ncbi:DinB family protein [Chitinophaga oryzae]|uniref:DinB family protein n=1 Tax=Chitinophaga oryzae TaxID=2725414 RepID=A0AAE6ZBQ3_9BACT|nr:DinB family protein [Chitinophaga oryzae]QJB30018.1 DinB family protein [Chitinophaga oryzae]QJB36515.1 DinB family protein [Chitinophaga oryzae]
MTALLKWTDRRFQWGHTADYVPFFMERLRATAPRLDEMTVLVPEDIMEIRDEGKWSVKEHIGHLADIELLHDKRLEDLLAGRTLTAADPENRATVEAHHNQYPISELVYHFRQVRDNFLKQVEHFSAADMEKRAMHPRLGQQMSLADILYFIAEHDNHHLTVIAAFLRKHYA